ncbi:phosphatase domain-containing protein [Salinibacterium sp. TMP30]|uniref:App1 family protein n=1 Tax=Salinibacterium sp. TMP30 TaxID=3138237 RepID=UPI003139E44D
MARLGKSPTPAQTAGEILHRAARIEDAFHRWRERRGRKRGLTTTIIPYSSYGGTEWARVLCRVVLTRGTEASKKRAEKVRGWRSFFSIPANDEVVTVTIGGTTVQLTPGRGGVIDEQVAVALLPGWQTATLASAGSDATIAHIFVVDPKATFGIISDVDDTVMVTALPRPLLAAWNTFVLDEHARRPVAGMAVLYDRLARANPLAPVIYLSTGAWNVAPTLTRFLRRNLYPRGAMLLTDWGPTHDRWFRSGAEHKRDSLRRLAAEFPAIKWLLVGDDGQHDEEIYGEFVASHPNNVAAVAIRQLSTGEAVLAGGRSNSAERERESPTPWRFAPDGARLAVELRELGLIND